MTDVVGLTVPVTLTDWERLTVGLTVCVTDTVELTVPVLLTDRVLDGVAVADQVKEARAVALPDPELDRLCV